MKSFRGLAGAFVVFFVAMLFTSGVAASHEKSVALVCEKLKPASRPDTSKLVLAMSDETEIFKDSGRFIAVKGWRYPGEAPPPWVDKGGLMVPGVVDSTFLYTFYIGGEEGEVFLYRWALKLEDGTECAYAAFADGEIYVEIDYPEISPSEGKDYPELSPLPFAVDARLFVSEKNGADREILGKFPVPKR
ncbi:MAG: hypothetical protein HYY55_01460 [Candidatus Niyogibacteria bacterium]|nr:MAG: hypothetical protein HYY55_01460 [Candidatus Niyogibacteria bacterium]